MWPRSHGKRPFRLDNDPDFWYNYMYKGKTKGLPKKKERSWKSWRSSQSQSQEWKPEMCVSWFGHHTLRWWSLMRIMRTSSLTVRSNLQDSTKFHTPREWTFNGKRLSSLIEGNLVFSVRSTENLSSDSRNKNTVNVVGQTCETCFTQVPLTGVCDFC